MRDGVRLPQPQPQPRRHARRPMRRRNGALRLRCSRVLRALRCVTNVQHRVARALHGFEARADAQDAVVRVQQAHQQSQAKSPRDSWETSVHRFTRQPAHHPSKSPKKAQRHVPRCMRTRNSGRTAYSPSASMLRSMRSTTVSSMSKGRTSASLSVLMDASLALKLSRTFSSIVFATSTIF